MSLKRYPRNLIIIPEHLSATVNNYQVEAIPYFSPLENCGSCSFYCLGLISSFIRDQRMETAEILNHIFYPECFFIVSLSYRLP